MSFLGPIPLILIVTLLLTVALFLTHRHITSLQAQIAGLEAQIPGIAGNAVQQALMNGSAYRGGDDDEDEDDSDYDDEDDDEEGLEQFVSAARESGARVGFAPRVPQATLVVQTSAAPIPAPPQDPAEIVEIKQEQEDKEEAQDHPHPGTKTVRKRATAPSKDHSVKGE